MSGDSSAIGKIDKMRVNPEATSSTGIGSVKHSDAEGKNSNREDMGTGYISTAAKHWIIVPILCFHMAGFIVLLFLAATFLDDKDGPYLLAWPALIGALAGIPFAFATNVKKLVDAVTTGGTSG